MGVLINTVKSAQTAPTGSQLKIKKPEFSFGDSLKIDQKDLMKAGVVAFATSMSFQASIGKIS